MAVDSRDKRFSMMGLAQPVPSVLPNPDGTVGTQDRAFLAFLYAGLTLSEVLLWAVQSEASTTWTEQTETNTTWTVQ